MRPNKEMFSGIKCVWFDLDDTLIDFKANSRAALAKIYVGEQLDRWFATADEWTDCYETINQRLWHQYAIGDVSREQLILERFSQPFIVKGETRATADFLSRHLHPVYLDALAAEGRLVQGADEALEAVRHQGFRTGVLSNGFREVQYRKMDRCGLTGQVDLIVLSDDIGINKPNPGIFRYAERQSGIITQSGHMMIGDNLSTDVTGAIGAGWRAVWLDRAQSEEPTPAGAIRVESLKEVISQLG